MQDCQTIDLGGVNCYLIKTDDGFILIDTGFAAKRTALESALENVGCQPGKLALIVLTHGDVDHVGNAAYLRTKYGSPIAMHPADVGMVEKGDMGWNRKVKPDYTAPLFRLIMLAMPLLGGSDQFDTFTPDSTLTEGADLARYGFAATVLHLPGHSKGSIGLLTPEGNLFCGDLLYHIFGKPRCLLIDNRADWTASLAKIKGLPIKTIYPGHGAPFLWSASVVGDGG